MTIIITYLANICYTHDIINHMQSKVIIKNSRNQCFIFIVVITIVFFHYGQCQYTQSQLLTTPSGGSDRFLAAVPNFTIIATAQGSTNICGIFKLGSNNQFTLNQTISVASSQAQTITLSDDGMWLGVGGNNPNTIVSIYNNNGNQFVSYQNMSVCFNCMLSSTKLSSDGSLLVVGYTIIGATAAGVFIFNMVGGVYTLNQTITQAISNAYA